MNTMFGLIKWYDTTSTTNETPGKNVQFGLNTMSNNRV